MINFIQTIGPFSCAHCDYETDRTQLVEQQERMFLAHIQDNHPDKLGLTTFSFDPYYIEETIIS